MMHDIARRTTQAWQRCRQLPCELLCGGAHREMQAYYCHRHQKGSCGRSATPHGILIHCSTADYSDDCICSSPNSISSSAYSSTDKVASDLRLTSPPCIPAVLSAGITPWLASASLRLPPASSPRMSSSAYAAGAKRSSIFIRVMASSLEKCRGEGVTSTDSRWAKRSSKHQTCWCKTCRGVSRSSIAVSS